MIKYKFFIRAITVSILSVALFGIGGLAQNPKTASDGNSANEQVEIQPGIRHNFSVRRDTGGLWAIHYLEIDVTRALLSVVRAMDEMLGSETTSSLAQRHGADAAVNGGYFRVAGTYRGEPVGTFISGGIVKSEPNGLRPSMAIDATGTRVAIVATKVEVWIETGSHRKIRLSGVDRPREANEAIVYTPDFHRTTLTNPDGLEIIVRAGKVVRITRSGSSLIPADGFVLSLSGTAVTEFSKTRLGAHMSFRQSVSYTPEPGWKPETVLGAGPVLLRAGILSEKFDGFAESFLKTRHPRTALGVRRDGTVVLLTVDGRQPGKSDGMSIYELQKLMAELKCIDAINLDGGGSTTMVVKGKVVNSVSDATGERPVSDAILVTAGKLGKAHSSAND